MYIQDQDPAQPEAWTRSARRLFTLDFNQKLNMIMSIYWQDASGCQGYDGPGAGEGLVNIIMAASLQSAAAAMVGGSCMHGPYRLRSKPPPQTVQRAGRRRDAVTVAAAAAPDIRGERGA
jgi:hypothetical protein